MQLYTTPDGLGIAIDLTEVEAVIDEGNGFVRLVTGADEYKVKADFDCVWKAVEREKEIRCV